MARPVDVSGEDFRLEVLEVDDLPVFVDFWSPTCPHCKALNPQYDQAAETTDGRVKFVKVSLADDPGLFKEYSVRATPTLVLFRGGEEIARTVGAKRAAELTQWLDEQLSD